MDGYDTQEPCWVCGVVDENKVEPRFLYVVCHDHYSVSPVDIPSRPVVE